MAFVFQVKQISWLCQRKVSAYAVAPPLTEPQRQATASTGVGQQMSVSSAIPSNIGLEK
jgi:hypothetical protein